MSRSTNERFFARGLVKYAGCLLLCLLAAGTALGTSGDGKALSRASKALRDGDYELAEKIYRDLLGKNAHDNDARLGLSFTLLKEREFQGAYDHAARVLLVDPLSARAHALLGSAVLNGGDFHASLEEFRTALALNADEALAVAGLAMIDFYENRLDVALRGLRRAVNLDSDEPDYLFNLGQAAARNEKYKEAADAYERFLIVAPKTDADRRARIRGLIDFLRYLGKQGSLYVPAGASKAVIKFESYDSRPILSVRVNGEKKLLRFVLDTGSGMSVISDETAKRLGIKAVARGGMARAVGGGGRFEIVYGYVSSIEIGDARVENIPVYIRHFFDDRVPVDGYLGLSVISKFIATVDYGDRSFTLVRRGQELAPGGLVFRNEQQTGASPIEIPLRTTSSGFLSGEVSLEGFQKPVNFIIDTGASISVVSTKLAENEEVMSHVLPVKMRVYGAAGITDDVKTVLLPRIALGIVVRERVSAAVLDMEPVNETAGFTQSGILGGNFLRHFRVSFDFSRGVIRLEPLAMPAGTLEGVAPEL